MAFLLSLDPLTICAASAGPDDGPSLRGCGIYVVRGRLVGHMIVVGEGARSEYRISLATSSSRRALGYYEGELVQARIRVIRLAKHGPVAADLLGIDFVLPDRRAQAEAVRLVEHKTCH